MPGAKCVANDAKTSSRRGAPLVLKVLSLIKVSEMQISIAPSDYQSETLALET